MRVAFYTLGCKVNQYETDLMIKKFKNKEYDIVEFDEKADIYIVNSCSVTNLSTRKSRQFLSRAKKMGGIVVLVGCYAQEIKDDKNELDVDIILGNEEKNDIVEYVQEYIENSNKIMSIGSIENVSTFNQNGILDIARDIRESVKIEDGCNNFCSYCIIPYVRGRVRSRDINQIKDEVENLVKNGVGEVVLVGIEIASYGKDLDNTMNLIDVIEQVSSIKDLKRIRLGSIEPRILTDENVIRLSKVSKLCPHFHISVQSLDNSVLKNMNRKYTYEFLYEKVEMLRKYFPDVALTCDVIVGFPGETDEEFENTLKRAKELGFYEMHVFKYSKRKWTKAANMQNQVDGNVANYRSETLIQLAQKLKHEYLDKHINTVSNVLFEEYIDGYLYGYTPNYIKVKVKGDENLWGKQLGIELCSIEGEIMIGKLLN